jgi:hypothetical protein
VHCCWQNPAAVKNPFYLMAPDWALIPAGGAGHDAATVIASQALISGAFSVTKQVIQLGYLPRLARSQHTSVQATPGQIYMPAGQLGAVRADHRAGGGDVPLVEQPGRGLRHCGLHAGHADHHRADLLRDSL